MSKCTYSFFIKYINLKIVLHIFSATKAYENTSKIHGLPCIPNLFQPYDLLCRGLRPRDFGPKGLVGGIKMLL